MASCPAGMRNASRSRGSGAGRLAELGVQAVQHCQAALVHRAHSARDYVVQQLFFAPEVVVDRGQVHLGLGDDVAQGRGRIALVGEQALGRIQNLSFVSIIRLLQANDLIIRLN